MDNLSRRTFLHSAGVVAAALVTPSCNDASQAASVRQYVFFTSDEAAFIEAAVARLIPSDELGPGALEADVPTYMDRQLAGAWGAGEGMYRGGPWGESVPEQGYQLAFTPAELFRTALRAIDEHMRAEDGSAFASLDPETQDIWLLALEAEQRDLGGVPSNVFFSHLLQLTIEGFFADPMYGGNRAMVGWKLVGFPGAYANYYEFVDQYGIVFDRPPMSIAAERDGYTTS